jgi:endogenous inhibitor of DNA gyrase (YacG/DUF329 family)
MMKENGDRTENPHFLNRTIHEFDCDYCGKHITWTGYMTHYIFKKMYAGEGTAYFCCERCKANYIKERSEYLKKEKNKGD